MQNRLRIIGGQWRSRPLLFGDSPGLRPTPVRVRETLFNWLQYDIAGSRCLDLFSGSGALGFEAASRGAEHVLQVENNAQACLQLKENAQKLAASQVEFVQQDVFRFLGGVAEHYNVVFLDPPFADNKALAVCQVLEDKRWLAEKAKIYIEIKRNQQLAGLPGNWRQLKNKTAGDVNYYLFTRKNL